MAVTVTDRRSILTEADSLTNWTTADDLVTDTFAEGTNSVATAINIGNNDLYFTTGTSQNYSDTLVYVYASVVATKDGWESGVFGLVLGDGTNRISWNQSGNDRMVFHHSDGPVDWQNFVIDGSIAKSYSSATEIVTRAGSLASLNLGAITQVGAYFITLSKALGGGNNCYVDIIRYGNDGLRVTGGGSGTEGTLLEVCVEDRSTATLKGHGMIRELTTGVYGCQGPLTFGDSGTSTNSYFLDENVILAYEDRYIADDKYYFAVEGHASATNTFGLTGATITTAGPEVTFRANSGNIDTMNINGCSFVDLGREINFTQASDGSSHIVRGTTFNNCGVVDIGSVGTFESNTITSPSLYGTQSAATYMSLGEASGNTSDIDISSFAGGYGLYIPATVTGTITLTNWTFDQSGTADIYWAGAAGTLTIGLAGTTNASTTATAGGTINLVSTTNFVLTGLKSTGVPGTGSTEVRIYNSGLTQELAGQEDVTTGTFSYEYGASEQQDGVVVQIHHVQYETIRLVVDWDGIDASIPIQQQFDRNYINP